MPLRGIYPLIQSLNENSSADVTASLHLKASGLSIPMSTSLWLMWDESTDPPSELYYYLLVMRASLEITHC